MVDRGDLLSIHPVLGTLKTFHVLLPFLILLTNSGTKYNYYSHFTYGEAEAEWGEGAMRGPGSRFWNDVPTRARWPLTLPPALSPTLHMQPRLSQIVLLNWEVSQRAQIVLYACCLRQTTASWPPFSPVAYLGTDWEVDTVLACAIPSSFLLGELGFLFWGPGGRTLPKHILGFIWGKLWGR